LGETQFD